MSTASTVCRTDGYEILIQPLSLGVGGLGGLEMRELGGGGVEMREGGGGAEVAYLQYTYSLTSCVVAVI